MRVVGGGSDSPADLLHRVVGWEVDEGGEAVAVVVAGGVGEQAAHPGVRQLAGGERTQQGPRGVRLRRLTLKHPLLVRGATPARRRAP